MHFNHLPQLRLIKLVLALGMIAGILLSYKLWLTERFFPHTPIFSFIPQPPFPADMIMLALAIALLLFIAFAPAPRRMIIAFCILFSVILILDQNRWQPWVFQYFCMMIMLLFVSWKRDDHIRHSHVVNAFRLIIAGIYLYSGLQKLNPKFFSDTYPWLLEPLTREPGPFLLSLAYAFPAIEIFMGIGLLFRRTRRIALVFAVIMHVLILLDMSPLGHNYNIVIWPWNIAMICFAIVLFRRDAPPLKAYRKSLRHRPVVVMFLLFWIAPALSFFNVWDSYLSASLYSGNTSNGVVWFTDDVRAKLPAEVQGYVQGGFNQNQLPVKYWSMMELGVPGYPEKRVFVNVKNHLEQYATGDSSDVYLLYSERLGLLGTNKPLLID
jgi:uncharacterized membrane protein YphA (DoxX/SURF4 family)